MKKIDISKCNLCPRECGTDRTVNAGLCGEGADMRISKIMLHRWEEPCISGSDPARGSGAVFFSGCPLHCVYCQNKEISCGGVGEIYSPARLAEEMKVLEARGAYNINFVTPIHFTHRIIEALDIYRPSIPTVFNTSGYERVETVKALEGFADVFLTDLKYGSGETAGRYSSASDYPEIALCAIEEMVNLAGGAAFDGDGMMKKGVIVRHLVLPGHRKDSEKALRLLKERVGTEGILLSLMSQYTPDFAPKGLKPLSRRVTSFEYNYVRDIALEMGFEGFGQDRQSAESAYTPDF